eukprot:11224630-Lingulodinium_polyedra.AAC.1
MNCVRFCWAILIGHNITGTRIDQDHELNKNPETSRVTDCRGLFDTIDRNQSARLGLAEKRTAIETRSR